MGPGDRYSGSYERLLSIGMSVHHESVLMGALQSLTLLFGRVAFFDPCRKKSPVPLLGPGWVLYVFLSQRL